MRDARHFSPTEVDPGQKKHWGSDFWYRGTATGTVQRASEVSSNL
jgi:hypothetical protein